MKLAECTDFSIKLCRNSPVVGGASSEHTRGTARSRCWSRLLGLGSVIAVVAAPSAAVNAEELASGLAKPTGFSAGTPGDSPFNTQLAQSRSELQRDADQLFEQLLKDPKNIDLTLRYAEAVAKLGNLEAAISSLERLLLLDRNYPGVRLELAQLYMRLNSLEVARAYVNQAEQEPGVTPAARARIQRLRAEIDQAESGSQPLDAGARIQRLRAPATRGCAPRSIRRRADRGSPSTSSPVCGTRPTRAPSRPAPTSSPAACRKP